MLDRHLNVGKLDQPYQSNGLMDITAIICVYNGAATIERALHSCKSEVTQILVVDDGSADKTCEIVQRFEALPVQIVKHEVNKGLGTARQTALEHCHSEFGVWLDADDELLPGRVADAFQYIENGADFVFGASQLIPADNSKTQVCLNPAFLTYEGKLHYQFARNCIPRMASPVFKVGPAREIGFASVRNAEDYHFFLNAVLKHANISFSNFIGYREYASNGSLSRLGDYQEIGKINALQDIGYSRLSGYLTALGEQLPNTDNVLVRSFFLAQAELWEALLDFCSHLEGLDSSKVSWYVSFFNGVSHYKLGDYKAAENHFRQTVENCANEEALNNLGAALKIQGMDGIKYFDAAISLNPTYKDANENLNGNGIHLTNCPLRRENDFHFTPLPMTQ